MTDLLVDVLADAYLCRLSARVAKNERAADCISSSRKFDIFREDCSIGSGSTILD